VCTASGGSGDPAHVRARKPAQAHLDQHAGGWVPDQIGGRCIKLGPTIQVAPPYLCVGRHAISDPMTALLRRGGIEDEGPALGSSPRSEQLLKETRPCPANSSSAG
jgi:hypothetical protein